MIHTDKSKKSIIQQIKAREQQEEAQRIREICEAWAIELLGKEELVKLSNKHKGLWYLPILDEEDKIEKCLILQPINRHILSYATTKISEEGLYIFLEAAMNECYLAGDREIIDDDEYFIPAANRFNKIMEDKRAVIVKR